MRIILASKSPRRRELLSKMFSDFEIVAVPTDESVDSSVLPCEAVRLIAEKKGLATYNYLMKEKGCDYLEDTLIISSDTLVAYDDIPLGKPRDERDAKRMLRILSGREHKVHTGIAVRRGERVVSGVATSGVVFRELTDQEIEDYVNGGEPMDKAGSYGIQGEGGKFVKEYIGDFDTVVGLSMKKLSALVEEINAE